MCRKMKLMKISKPARSRGPAGAQTVHCGRHGGRYWAGRLRIVPGDPKLFLMSHTQESSRSLLSSPALLLVHSVCCGLEAGRVFSSHINSIAEDSVQSPMGER